MRRHWKEERGVVGWRKEKRGRKEWVGGNKTEGREIKIRICWKEERSGMDGKIKGRKIQIGRNRKKERVGRRRETLKRETVEGSKKGSGVEDDSDGETTGRRKSGMVERDGEERPGRKEGLERRKGREQTVQEPVRCSRSRKKRLQKKNPRYVFLLVLSSSRLLRSRIHIGKNFFYYNFLFLFCAFFFCFCSNSSFLLLLFLLLFLDRCNML